MNHRKRLAILAQPALADKCRRALASEYDVVLCTDDRGAFLEAVNSGACELGALCNPEDGLAAQLEQADSLLSQGCGVLLLRPSVPHGILGLGLARRKVGEHTLLPFPPNRMGSVPFSKRLFDVLFSAAVLVLGLPVWLLIACLVKLQDGGPVFFSQERVGRGGRRFSFLKFRTMWPDADEHREWYAKRYGQDGHVFKLSDDPRRTPVGRVLRRFSLDEVPQFLHALSGRMSVVGPRPPLPSEVATYKPWQRMRLSGWFGLTGLWQVCGRSEIRDLDDIVLLDALYLHNHSFWLDLRIVLRTLRVVLSRHGAC